MLKKNKKRKPRDKREEADYQKAMNEQIALMKKGFHLGTKGKISILREELHKRK